MRKHLDFLRNRGAAVERTRSALPCRRRTEEASRAQSKVSTAAFTAKRQKATVRVQAGQAVGAKDPRDSALVCYQRKIKHCAAVGNIRIVPPGYDLGFERATPMPTTGERRTPYSGTPQYCEGRRACVCTTRGARTAMHDDHRTGGCTTSARTIPTTSATANAWARDEQGARAPLA